MTAVRTQLPNHLVLYGISWDMYTGMMDALSEKRFPHVYQRGTLEIRAVAERRERVSHFLGRLIEMASLELDMPIRSVGSATRRHQKLEHGIEPDESYYLGSNAPARAKARAAKTRVPDLVVEIEWSRAVLSKLDSYAVLGVKEVWRYHKAVVEFFVLNNQGQYDKVPTSHAFPVITAESVKKLVSRLLKDEPVNPLVREFVNHLRAGANES